MPTMLSAAKSAAAQEGADGRGALLPPSEETVMAALWACPSPAARRQIAARLPAGCAWADSTLLNFLARLESRGFV